jgi:hypothetical protein
VTLPGVRADLASAGSMPSGALIEQYRIYHSTRHLESPLYLVLDLSPGLRPGERKNRSSSGSHDMIIVRATELRAEPSVTL